MSKPEFRPVTDKDFWMPEYVGKDPDDYEFRGDGKIVRKDRWEMAIHKIRGILGDGRREFDVDDVVDAIHVLVKSIPTPEGDSDE